MITSTHRTTIKYVLIFIVVVAALVILMGPRSSRADLLLGADEETLARELQVTPSELGDGSLDGLQYADPAEQLDLMEPPIAHNFGDAHLAHPITIPPGRAGVEPGLALTYDSGTGSSWVGTGWNLGVGEIVVDTRFGVPRYKTDVESEGYILDGDVLSPTAVVSNFESPRVANRDDYTRRVEDQFEYIIRRGDSPTNYRWEVTDKLGNKRFYGAMLNGDLDPDAVQTDADGNIFRWALSAEKDISDNIIRYDYVLADGKRVGAESKKLGEHLYLNRILYTGSIAGNVPDDPAYEVRFLRDDDLTVSPSPRMDIIIDARGGFIGTTSDLLRRIEIKYGAPVNNGAVARSTWDTLVRAYDLNYVEGAFGKSLLASIDQLDSTNTLVGSHDFTYYDDVRRDGSYNGLSSNVSWDPGNDDVEPDADLLGLVDVSALGGSVTLGGDIHTYVGFNLAAPKKSGSVGGAVSVDVSNTEGIVEFIDINGDLLPDKVFREAPFGPVKYRLNQSGPDGGTTFGPATKVLGLNSLSSETSAGFAGGPEAHVGVSVQFSVAGDVSVGRQYFEDVNNDGLPDFVMNGRVYFNRLDQDGNPKFADDSVGTAVPIDSGSATLPTIDALAEVEATQREQSLLADTVRRWVAPFDGTINIDAPVTLSPPDGETSLDGVRAAIQVDSTELWSDVITTPDSPVTPAAAEVNGIKMDKGSHVYFRVGSIDDGAFDYVLWDPTITYTAYDAAVGTPGTDANGLSQQIFQASNDFALAGRPDIRITMPLTGTVRLLGDLIKGKTSDNITVEILLNDEVKFSKQLAHSFVGAEIVDTSFDVTGPSESSFDQVIVRVRTDTPIDVTQVQWSPRLFYTSATGPDGEPFDVGSIPEEPNIELEIPWDIDVYDKNNLFTPQQAWTSGITKTIIVTGTFSVSPQNPSIADDGGEFVVSVKGPNGLVAKGTTSVSEWDSGLHEAVITAEVVGGEDYFFELTSRKPDFSARLANPDVSIKFDAGGIPVVQSIPFTYHYAGRQGIFPIPYRGWAYAGYNADDRTTDPLDEDAFIFKQDDFPSSEPTRFDDLDYKDPTASDAYPYIPYLLDDGTPVWRGFKENLVGGAGFARSSRTAADNPAIVIPGGAGAQAVPKIGVSGPILGLVAGIPPVNVSASGGPTWGILDYLDLNGDGFPDIVAPGYAHYTGPRGGYMEEDFQASDVVAVDTSLAIGVGFSGSALEIKGNSKGQANGPQDAASTSGNLDRGGKSSGSSAGNGKEASGDEFGVSLGGGASATFTNPAYQEEDWAVILDAIESPLDAQDLPEILGEIGGPFSLEYEQEYADVNGDDLPDRVGVSLDGIDVQLNLGYKFADPIRWAGGGFENSDGYSVNIGPGLGFQVGNKEFSGGLALNHAINLSRSVWIDVDGDGVLDRLRKPLTDVNDIKVAFGTGAGLLPEVSYGDFQIGSIVEEFDGGIPIGQAIAQGDSAGLGGGADFTFGIGPLCIKLCYIIVNPGAHVQTTISNNQVQFIDVNGDGYPDSVKSIEDNDLNVRMNLRGRTNLLSMVDNPLGGQIRIGYTRDGNTVSQPYPLWTMSSVEYDDNRPGDGPDTLLTTYDYQDNVYNSLEREFYGYATVIEKQRDFQEDGTPLNDPVIRQIERIYSNSSVFEAGLLKSETLQDPNGTWLKRTEQSWDLVDINTGSRVTVPTVSDLDSANALLAFSASRQLKAVEFFFYTDMGVLGQKTRHTFAYDNRGNVIYQVDEGELETTGDDLFAYTTYSECPATRVNVPSTFEIRDISGALLRRRIGADDLCLNAVPIRVEETINEGGTVAVTEMTFDAWGNYNSVTYPANADGERYRVDYVYDADRHADIAHVTDSYGLQASASFDGKTGQITSRTDPNDQTWSYTYDAFGRLASIIGPYEQGTGNVTVTFAYFPTAPDYAYATASHFDVFNPGDTIDTAIFLDGIGRATQTKQDGTVFASAQSPADDVMVVSGAVEFDTLGRPVQEWYPTTEALGSIGVFNSAVAPTDPLVTTWDLRDQPLELQEPNGSITTTSYDFGADSQIFGGASLFKTTVTDPLLKPVTSWTDMRGNVLAIDGHPKPPSTLPARRTRYTYNPLGELISVTDPAGSITTHSYDLLGRNLTTDTPNGGLIESTWDPAGNLIAVVDPILRPLGQQVNYEYDYARLIAINYPDSTPDVSYTYGAPGAANNGSGRMIALSDGARDQTFAYDKLGNVTSETSIMKVHNLDPTTVISHTYTMSFTYDGLGRFEDVTFPDGEVLSYDYDSGGELKSATGTKSAHTYPYVTRLEYDQFFDRKFIAYGNGTETEYTYHPLTRDLVRILTNTPDREVQDLIYTYDAVGKITRLFNDVPKPATNLFVGPFTHNYEYDAFYRIKGADGEFNFAPRKRRTYAFSNEYDEYGNIAVKSQTDTIYNNPKGKKIKPTTYDINFTYNPTKPNQLLETADRTYTYDAAGNFSGWQDKHTGQNRSASFDMENRMVKLADEGSTTIYTYDHANQLAIERGPGGELSFVNQWYTFENGSLPRKHIFAGDDRVVIKREDPADELEFKQYYQHKNLQGSTNIVTDQNALVFQNLLYFPSGEIWIHEKSTEFPTPYRFAAGYFDEFRAVINFGQRWYDPRDQFFLSTDPILVDDPDSVIADPALLPAYTYAASNPVSFVDPTGTIYVPAWLQLAFPRVSLTKSIKYGGTPRNLLSAFMSDLGGIITGRSLSGVARYIFSGSFEQVKNQSTHQFSFSKEEWKGREQYLPENNNFVDPNGNPMTFPTEAARDDYFLNIAKTKGVGEEKRQGWGEAYGGKSIFSKDEKGKGWGEAYGGKSIFSMDEKGKGWGEAYGGKSIFSMDGAEMVPANDAS